MENKEIEEKYNIIYVSDNKNDISQFKRHIKNNNLETIVNLIIINPINEILFFIDDIFENKPDAIISNYKFDKDIEFTGMTLINELISRLNCPLFVLASLKKDTINEKENINLIYNTKVIYYDKNNQSMPFIKKIICQIRRHKTKLKQKNMERENLFEKSKKKKLNLCEQERLIELDNYVEKALCSSGSIPGFFKKMTYFKRIQNLVKDTEKLIKELKKELKKENCK